MNKVLISIRPEWVAKILNHEQSLIIRKTMPKCQLPCEVYIYCTKGKQICFNCDRYVIVDTKDKNFLKNKGILDLQGKVVAKFTLKETINYGLSLIVNGCKGSNTIGNDITYIPERITNRKSCLSKQEIWKYGNLKRILYGWCIDDLEIFDEPKTLTDYGLEKAPQSWCYIKE